MNFFSDARRGVCGLDESKERERREKVGGVLKKKTKRYAPPAPRKPQENKIIRFYTLFPYFSLSLQNFVSISNRRQNACFTDARKKEKKRIRAHFLRETRIDTRSGEVVRRSSRRSERERDS